MSFTMRERSAMVRMILLWMLVTLFAALAGPFGTFEGLGFGGRLGYWAVITGLSISLTKAQLHLLRRCPQWIRFASQLPYGLCLAGIAHGLNLLIFPEWGGWSDFGFLALVTLSVVLMIEAAVFLYRSYFQPSAESSAQLQQPFVPPLEPDPETLFQRRLPLEKRGSLIRLEAQDHYLLVVTDRGSETLLMRLGDAQAELSGPETSGPETSGTGLRVHRSHWVNPAQVLRHERHKGRDFLQMSDGAAVPVSRSYKDAAQAIGLF